MRKHIYNMLDAKHTDRIIVLEKEGGFGVRQCAGEKCTAKM